MRNLYAQHVLNLALLPPGHAVLALPAGKDPHDVLSVNLSVIVGVDGCEGSIDASVFLGATDSPANRCSHKLCPCDHAIANTVQPVHHALGSQAGHAALDEDVVQVGGAQRALVPEVEMCEESPQLL